MQNKLHNCQSNYLSHNYGIAVRHEYQRRVMCPDLYIPEEPKYLETFMIIASFIMAAILLILYLHTYGSFQ